MSDDDRPDRLLDLMRELALPFLIALIMLGATSCWFVTTMPH